jgi:thiol-disulfide isomerase/thioredoxin
MPQNSFPPPLNACYTIGVNTLTNPASLKEQLSGDGKTAVLFVTSMCPFCRRFRPIFEQFAKNRAKEFDFLTVILDDQDNPLWEEYRIEVVPTAVLFQGGRVISRLDGRLGEGLSSRDLESL